MNGFFPLERHHFETYETLIVVDIAANCKSVKESVAQESSQLEQEASHKRRLPQIVESLFSMKN